jgi:hypothetical protein
VKCGFCLGRRRRARLAAARPLLALVLVALVLLALAGCGTTATDANEPNDDLNSAHALAAGESARGVIGPDDSDVFSCETPADGALHTFTVTVRTEDPQDIELQVGASIPGAWEGITWPGWEAVSSGGSIEVAGELRRGTVLMFLKGAEGTAYSVTVLWK